jgi:hypothetical protein
MIAIVVEAARALTLAPRWLALMAMPRRGLNADTASSRT